MSVQIFLQGRLVGIEEFLVNAKGDLEGRSHWVSLLAEVLPRALLAELGLSRMLLGASGGERFLAVLPSETRQHANEFMSRSADHIAELSAGSLRLVWAITENLGDWSDVRRRLTEEMTAGEAAPLARLSVTSLEALPELNDAATDYFHNVLELESREAHSVGWSPETPGMILFEGGKHRWTLGNGNEDIPYARCVALDDNNGGPASTETLAGRGAGRGAWGVLRGDVDSAGIRIRRALNIEEHIQLSVLYKHFFAGELQMLCSMPEFWRRVTLLSSGADNFAIYGAWDALPALAREIQRVFQKFAEHNLKEYPGPEGKTISMAIAVASENESIADVFARAGHNLRIAKTAGKDSIYLFGRTLEWKQLADAAETKETLARLIRDFGASPQLLTELASFYRGAQAAAGTQQSRTRNDRVDRPWRFHRRLNLVLGGSKNKEFQRLRGELISDFTGRKAAQIRLRPQGRVALEWARLETEA